MDPEKIAAALAGVFAAKIEKALEPLVERLAALEQVKQPDADEIASDVVSTLLGGDGLKALVDLQVTEAVAQVERIKGDPGEPGKDGADGKDGIGLAGCLIDREGNLVVTLANGEAKNLGPVVGRDGVNGNDGVGITDLVRTYDSDTHEIVEKWADKELRYPAGGISHGGYWREGTKAVSCQTWTHAGTCWIAKTTTEAKPSRESSDWEIFASKGRDGLDYKQAPQREPVKLHGN